MYKKKRTHMYEIFLRFVSGRIVWTDKNVTSFSFNNFAIF